jgi:hypothetical protein
MNPQIIETEFVRSSWALDRNRIISIWPSHTPPIYLLYTHTIIGYWLALLSPSAFSVASLHTHKCPPPTTFNFKWNSRKWSVLPKGDGTTRQYLMTLMTESICWGPVSANATVTIFLVKENGSRRIYNVHLIINDCRPSVSSLLSRMNSNAPQWRST